MSPTSVSTFDLYYGHTMSKILTVHFIKETHAKLLLDKGNKLSAAEFKLISNLNAVKPYLLFYEFINSYKT